MTLHRARQRARWAGHKRWLGDGGMDTAERQTLAKQGMAKIAGAGRDGCQRGMWGEGDRDGGLVVAGGSDLGVRVWRRVSALSDGARMRGAPGDGRRGLDGRRDRPARDGASIDRVGPSGRGAVSKHQAGGRTQHADAPEVGEAVKTPLACGRTLETHACAHMQERAKRTQAIAGAYARAGGVAGVDGKGWGEGDRCKGCVYRWWQS